jgi:hypothetical protein
MTAGRKIFHCAVDETVLTTSLGEIKKWLSHGAITVFVPLYSEFSRPGIRLPAHVDGTNKN